jgi:two-component system, chemotaxis family, sensor kinase CheA
VNAVPTPDYLPIFLADAREHLQVLNLAVVQLEDDPADTEIVDAIFRAAHSFKGMAAMMGFESIAALTHEMENVFELMRRRREGLGREAVDVLLQCLDALEEAVESLDAGLGEELEPTVLIAQLQLLVRERDSDGKPRLRAIPPPEPARDAGSGVLVRVRLSADALMPSVRAYQVLTALGAHGTITSSVPAESELQWFTAHELEVWLETGADPETLRTAVGSVSEVADVFVDAHGKREPARPATRRPAANTVRVDADRLDALMHAMAEMVVQRTHIESLVQPLGDPDLTAAVQELVRRAQKLHAIVTKLRMIPVDSVLVRFPRFVRDLSGRLGKNVELVLSGQETELDRGVVDPLGEALMHLVRNALDHGVETPAERAAAGKPKVATIGIGARYAGGKVEISVSDDGPGIDADAVGRKALELGLIAPEELEGFDLSAATEMLFVPGFTTVAETSEISGRGVGMDAVRTMVRDVGGEVVIHSEPGRGTIVQIQLPLTLAILPGLLVEIGGRQFGIPLDRVEGTVKLEDHTIRSLSGAPVLVDGDDAYRLIDGADAFGQEPSGERGQAVIVRSRQRRVAVTVERLLGHAEIVTQPLPPAIALSAALAGVAVLSDGSTVLVVECDGLSARSRNDDHEIWAL